MHAALQVLSDGRQAIQASGILATCQNQLKLACKGQTFMAGMQANVPDHLTPTEKAPNFKVKG